MKLGEARLHSYIIWCTLHHMSAYSNMYACLHTSPPSQSTFPSRGKDVAEWDSPPPNPGSLSNSPCHIAPKVHMNTTVNIRSYIYFPHNTRFTSCLLYFIPSTGQTYGSLLDNKHRELLIVSKHRESASHTQ